MIIINDYFFILILIFVGIGFVGMFIIIGLVVGFRLCICEKVALFEFGFFGKGMEGYCYDVKFFMIVLVFLVFDVEIVFFYLWMV